MRRIKTGLLLTMIVLALSTNTVAAPPLLKVVTEEFPPYNYTVNGKIKGISTSIITETLKRSGLKYHLKVYPWKRAYHAITLREKNVLIYSIYRSAEREPLFAAWIGPILPPAAVYFYKLKERSDLKVGLAQIAPIWLKRAKTLEKIGTYVVKAAAESCRLVAFGEALIPGYPFWIELTEGTRFDSPVQKELHSHYMSQAVQIESGDLNPICTLAAENKLAVVLGCIERAADRGGHSLYCARVYIAPDGRIGAVHRKWTKKDFIPRPWTMPRSDRYGRISIPPATTPGRMSRGWS